MIKTCLVFESEEQATTVLEELETVAVDVVGVIYKPTGETVMTEGFEVPLMAAIPGWHVNVITETELPELVPFTVVPNNPVRVWF
jgi:hypothetical protein